VIFCFLTSSYLIQHGDLKFYLFLQIISFFLQVSNIPYFLYPFISCWSHRQIPQFSHCEQSFNKHDM
jgi:hypothetical protein